MLNDLSYAARRLLRNPGFAAAAVLTLALGIGANTAVFTVINTVLLGELPVPEPDRVVKVYTSDYSSSLYGGSSYPDFADYRDRAASFTDLAAYSTFTPMNLGTALLRFLLYPCSWGYLSFSQGSSPLRPLYEAL